MIFCTDINKNSNKNTNKNILTGKILQIAGFSAFSIYLISPQAIAYPRPNQIVSQQVKPQSYGLGQPKTSSTGGSVRLTGDERGGFESSGKPKTLPILALLVPEDGARTASSRPTVYWYMILNGAQNYKLTFSLNETAAEDSKVVLEQEITVAKGGLFKFQIPHSLETNVPRRWSVKCIWPMGKVVMASGILAVAEPKPEIKMAISSAKTDLDKARVYADNGFWYDALDAYSSWINANPKDAAARSERDNLIGAGFKESFKENKEFDLNTFIDKVNLEPVQEFKHQNIVTKN